LLKIKATYTAAELKKPFVVAQVYIDPTKDPEVARALRARVVQDVRELFGPGQDDQLASAVPQLPAPADGEFTTADDFDEAPGTAVPEPQDEAAHKADMREKIAGILTARKLTEAQVEKWCQKNLGCSYQEASLDGLDALAQALAEKAS
jgi:hypothetical protein